MTMLDKERKMQEVKELDFSDEADLLRVLAHPVRLQIAYGLSEVGDCNVKNIWTCLGLPQSNVSQHLNLMKSRGIIDSQRQGVEVHYFVKHPIVRDLIRCLLRHKQPGFTDSLSPVSSPHGRGPRSPEIA